MSARRRYPPAVVVARRSKAPPALLPGSPARQASKSRLNNNGDAGGSSASFDAAPSGSRHLTDAKEAQLWAISHKPWYGLSVKALRRAEIDGEPVPRSARLGGRAEDGLYRYTPVPPVYRDEDGYLVEDGMWQDDNHLRQTSLWYHALRRRLPTATVCSDLPLHYRRGDCGATLVPDLFVALRVRPPRQSRESYKLWQHPAPDLVVEMLSDNSASKADVHPKRRTYEHLGVREYWLFDPAGLELSTPLAGLRLRAGRYQPIAADAAGRLRSEVLGLHLHVRGGELRFRDPATGKDLHTYDEAVDARVAAQRRAGAEKDRADAAENRATAERDRADAAENRADAAERELASLRSRLQHS